LIFREGNVGCLSNGVEVVYLYLLKEVFTIARLKRIWIPEHFHHVGNRGNWQHNLYRDEEDSMRFLDILMQICHDYQVEVTSYCLMSNHYHIILRTKLNSLSTVMGRLNKLYADYYNKRYQVKGHLFEKRYFSFPLFDAVSELEVSKYIHMNPVKARITQNPYYYKWSSFQFYVSTRKTPPVFLQLDPILEHFPGNTNAEKKRNYCDWMVKTELDETRFLKLEVPVKQH
jgi:putative transposase